MKATKRTKTKTTKPAPDTDQVFNCRSVAFPSFGETDAERSRQLADRDRRIREHEENRRILRTAAEAVASLARVLDRLPYSLALALAMLVGAGCQIQSGRGALQSQCMGDDCDPIRLDASGCVDVPDGALVTCCGTRIRTNCVPCGAYDEGGIARPIDGSPPRGTVAVASERIECEVGPQPAAPGRKE